MKIRPFNIECSWEEVKDKIMEVHHEITEEDLIFIEGEEDILLERLAGKMNTSKEKIRIFIESISHTKGIAS